MDEMPTIRPILTNGESLPKLRKVNIFDLVWFCIYNSARKPWVIMRQRELARIESRVKRSMSMDVLPVLLKKARLCKDCACAYETLLPQILLSQIKFLLTRMRCDEHPEPMKSFLEEHEKDFQRAEAVSRWINGF